MGFGRKGRNDYVEYIAAMVYNHALPGVFPELVADGLYDVINPRWPPYGVALTFSLITRSKLNLRQFYRRTNLLRIKNWTEKYRCCIAVFLIYYKI